MAWSIASGLAYVSERSLARPEFNPEVPLILSNVGRQVWTWEDCWDTSEEMRHDIATTALRPTAAFPADMRNLSLRTCVGLLGGNYEAALRMAVKAGAAAPKGLYLDRSLGLMTYGAAQDATLPLLRRCASPKATVMTGLSAEAGYLHHHSAGMPFAVVVLRNTLFEVQMAPRLVAAQDEIVAQLKDVYQRLGAHLDPDAAQAYPKVVDHLLRDVWRPEAFRPSDPEPDYEQVLARLILTRWHDPRALSASLVYQLALLSGVSPAAVVRFTLDDIRRRGTSSMTPKVVKELGQLVGEVQTLAAGRCAKEIENLLPDIEGAWEVGTERRELASRVGRARGLEQAFWEFEDRLK